MLSNGHSSTCTIFLGDPLALGRMGGNMETAGMSGFETILLSLNAGDISLFENVIHALLDSCACLRTYLEVVHFVHGGEDLT